jgi:hypothetical protein
VVYGEEYSKFKSAEDIDCENISKDGYYTYIDDAILMNAKAAAKYFDYTDYPSGYCLFEKFCSTDPDYEVMEVALEWKKTADKLPAEFTPQIEKIWTRWNKNREELEKIYPLLPRSVFQADINYSNCLLDNDNSFKGVYDFNLAGRDVYINYLFREIPYVMITENFKITNSANFTIECIMHGIKVSKRVYKFSEIERKAALLLYRCIKPLFYDAVENLKNAGDDFAAINKCLDETERIQTQEIDFAGAMIEDKQD